MLTMLCSTRWLKIQVCTGFCAMMEAELIALQSRKTTSNDYGLLSLLEDVPKSDQLMPQIVFDTLPVIMESEDSAQMCFL
jgi:hypothetical protein